MATGVRRSLTERMQGAARLDIATYEEVEADTTATSQAAAVVAISAVAQAIGGVGDGTTGVLLGLASAFVGWLIWSGVTYLIGEKLFGGTATWGELLRTLGFAQAPGVLAALGIIPILGGIVMFVVWIWQMVAGVVAIRQALDIDTGKAVITAVISFFAVMRVMMVPMAMLAAMIGAMS